MYDPDIEVLLREMDPNEYRDGESALEYGISQSPFGDFFIVVTPDGVASLWFIEGRDKEKILSEFRKRREYAWMTRDDIFAQSLVKEFLYSHEAKTVRVCVQGTPFQLEVWSALMDIPFGETVTYAELARRMGRPRAVRAVATAISKNNVAYLIPCHRVVRSDGSPGGYRWGGPKKKMEIIAWEKERKGGRGPCK